MKEGMVKNDSCTRYRFGWGSMMMVRLQQSHFSIQNKVKFDMENYRYLISISVSVYPCIRHHSSVSYLSRTSKYYSTEHPKPTLQ
jgi:hypothetical protein